MWSNFAPRHLSSLAHTARSQHEFLFGLNCARKQLDMCEVKMLARNVFESTSYADDYDYEDAHEYDDDAVQWKILSSQFKSIRNNFAKYFLTQFSHFPTHFCSCLRQRSATACHSPSHRCNSAPASRHKCYSSCDPPMRKAKHLRRDFKRKIWIGN